ncbi:MAG: CoA-binding protein [Pseudomonadota bacterium]
MHENPSNSALKVILSEAKNIALVGASSNRNRPSHAIMQRLQSVGYRVIPVNPNELNILGEKVYASLLDIPKDIPIDIVNVFRRSEYTLPIAQEAASIKAKTLWLQSGVYNEETALYAQHQGLNVIMDLCIAVEYSLLIKRPLPA